MSLLRTIQDSAVSADRPITELLRQCKVLSVRLGSTDFERWVDRELNGYPDQLDLPDYRKADVQAAGHFSGPMGSGLRDAPIPHSCVPEQWHDVAFKAFMMQPIGSYEDLLRKDEGTFRSPWPPDLTAHVGQRIYNYMNCLQAWQVIPRGLVVSLIDTVRNRVLAFALELEKISPDAGDTPRSDTQISREQVSQVFHTYIQGNVGNMATGSHQFSQVIERFVAAGDRQGLKEQLALLGFAEGDLEALAVALDEDAKEGPGLGKRVGAWIGNGIAKAAAGVLTVGVTTAGVVLPKLISQYLGLPGE